MKRFYTYVIFTLIFCSSLNLALAENVEFPDINLANKVRAALDLPAGADIPKAQLATLTVLDASAPEEQINDLTGLEHATQLTALNLNFNQIRDLSPLTGLTNLTVLDLEGNQISDVTALIGLVNLEELYLAGNPITDKQPLRTLLEKNPDLQLDIDIPGPTWMPDGNLYAAIREALGLTPGDTLTPQALQGLTQLDASWSGISDLTGLEHATQLIGLSLQDNRIRAITPLAGLTNLTTLDLGRNEIRDITPLAGLTELTELRLDGNAISDIAPLAGLTELRYLSLENNKISSVSSLTGLTNLNELWLSGNLITDRIIEGTPLEETPLWDLLQANPNINTDIPINETQRQTLSNKNLEINAGIPLYALVSSQGRFPSFSPDGTLLAYAYMESDDSDDYAVKLWDVGTKQNIATLEGHTGIVWSVSFSPDGKLIASTDIISDENDAIVGSTIKLWDIGTKENIATFEVDVPASGTYEDWALRSVLLGGPSIPFSPDGTLLAYSVPDDTTKLWNVQTRENIATLSEDAAFVSFSPDGTLLATVGLLDNKVILWDLTSYLIPSEPEKIAADVNGDGVVDVLDLVIVAANFGSVNTTPAADVNDDGEVNREDILAVLDALEAVAAAPAATSATTSLQRWIDLAKQYDRTDADFQKGLAVLENLLMTLREIEMVSKETALLANYPNPFNPETWIPYQLAKPADVKIFIYTMDGKLVRTLALGHQAVGKYHHRSRAAYWDGRNNLGEPVAAASISIRYLRAISPPRAKC